MTADHRQTTRGQRMRFIRPTCILLALLTCFLLIPAAAASANVMKKHRAAYKAKLNYYEKKMDGEIACFTLWRQSEESTRVFIENAEKTDPNLFEAAKATALEQRTQLRKATMLDRDKTYADIAAFRAKAVKWFKKPTDKDRFKAGLATMRFNFVDIYSADEDLLLAFLYLSDAYYQTAADAVFRAGVKLIDVERFFPKSLKELRKLQ